MTDSLRKFPLEKAGYLLLLLCGVLGTWGAFLDRYRLPYAEFLLPGAVLAAALLGGLAFLPKKARIGCSLGLLAVWIFVCVRYWRQIAWGLVRCFERLLPTVTIYISLDFPALPSISPWEERMALLAACCLLLPYLTLLAWAVVGRKSFWFSFLLTFPVFVFSWGPKTAAPVYAVVCSAFFWMAMLLQNGIPRRFRGSSGRALGWILLASGLVSSLVILAPPERYEPWDGAADVRAQLNDAASGMARWFPGGQGGGTVLSGEDGEIDLGETGNRSQPDGDALRVYSYRIPEQLYLRGYSAAVYTGHSWEQLEEGMYSSEIFGFQPLSFLERRAEGTAANVTVEPLVPSRWVYAPYLITDMEPRLQTEDDVGFLANGQEQYSFQSLASSEWGVINGENGGQWLEYPTFSYSYLMVDSFMYDGELLTYMTEPGRGPVIQNLSQLSPEQEIAAYNYLYNFLEGQGLYTVPSYARDSSYVSFLQGYYTQLPEGLRESLLEWWRENYAPGTGSMARDQAITGTIPETGVPYWLWGYAAGEVARTIRDSGVYTLTPGLQPRNRDFAEYFLTESNEGYCVHFATAATVMLRALGIPARYAEGYVVDGSSFDSQGWATVPARNAHAWAEIWLPGTGWVPVEATPGGPAGVTGGQESSEESSLPEESEPPSSSAEEPSVSSAPEEESAPEISQPESSEAAGENTPESQDSWVWSIALGGLLLILAAAAPFGARWLRMAGRKKKMFQPDSRKAALEIYGVIMSLSRFGGPDPSPEALAIARKARFSPHEISADELETLLGEYREHRQKTWENLSKRRRLRFWFWGYPEGRS